MQIVPIILSSDNNYAPYMSIIMISILKNAKSNSFFDFYLLVPDSFNEKNKQKIQKDCAFYKNKQINFVNMNCEFNSVKRMISHISEQTYYRLKAADILPEKYDKCLYFDVDVIVNIDLKEYFDIDISDYYIGGVKAGGFHFKDKWVQQYCEKIGLADTKTYINAGAIIMNLKKIREDNMTPVMCQEAYNNYPCVDQDVLNKLFYNRIKLLPLKFNLTSTMKRCIKEKYDKMLEVYGKQQLEEADSNPAIIHFADKIKPWDSPFIPMSFYFWKNALCSCYLPKLIKDLLFNIRKRGDRKIINILGLKIKFRVK